MPQLLELTGVDTGSITLFSTVLTVMTTTCSTLRTLYRYTPSCLPPLESYVHRTTCTREFSTTLVILTTFLILTTKASTIIARTIP